MRFSYPQIACLFNYLFPKSSYFGVTVVVGAPLCRDVCVCAVDLENFM